ncbi:MAG: hypothetical protein IIA45_01715 [Bacteroidetes bacterium]|nr:hypothetical protein [Bacteroidota bacterium]
MDNKQEQLDTLQQMRKLMEQSSRFISLSGLAGVFVGIIALAGGLVGYWYFDYSFYYPDYGYLVFDTSGELLSEFLIFLFLNATAMLVLALFIGTYLTIRKAKKKGLPMWDNVAKRMVINLFIPLAAGGVFILTLLTQKQVELVVPVTLIFYGLALINGSKYTLNDIRYLGIIQIILGLICAYYNGYALLFWIMGFGILHIVYGLYLHFKYER